jgi:hypothetical protein
MKTCLRYLAVPLLAIFAAASHADPAVVINPAGGCNIFNGDGDLVFTDSSQAVVTQSANDNALFKCKASVTNDNGRAVRFDNASTGTLCSVITSTGIQLTDDWHNTVSASGKSSLVCHFKS